MDSHFSTPSGHRSALGVGLLAALAIHAGVLLGWKPKTGTVLPVPLENAQTEVELVESAPLASPSGPKDPASQAVPPPTLPIPAPPPEATPDEALVERPPERPTERPPERVVQRAPSPARMPDPRAATATPIKSPGASLSKAKTDAEPGAAPSSGTGKTFSKPVYKIPPSVKYPAESRSGAEQGTVMLRITVNAEGRPVAVMVATSSGYSRLDRAAVEGGWRCRISNATEGAQFEAPLRFSLKD